MQQVKVTVKMDLEKCTALGCPAPLESWSQELRGSGREGGYEQRGEDVNSVVPTLWLVEEVSCRAVY